MRECVTCAGCGNSPEFSPKKMGKVVFKSCKDCKGTGKQK